MGSANKVPIINPEPGGPTVPTLAEMADDDLLRASFNAFPESLLLIENEQVLAANLACAKLFGFADANDLVGQPLGRLLTLQQRFCRDMLESPPPNSCAHPCCEKNIRRRNGEEVHVLARCTHFQHRKRNLLVIALRELNQLELTRSLRDDQLRFRAIFEGAGIGIATSTLQGRIIETNSALSRMLGYSPSELAGMDARDLHPGDFHEDEQRLKELMWGACDSYELEKRFRKKDGSYVCGHLTVSLVRDASQDPAFVIAMVEDTTARKRAEEQLREAEKMEVIGRLAGGVAHDFNNLLTGILLYCDLLLGAVDADSPLRTHVQEIRIAGEQGAALTQQLLQIARKQAPQPRRVQLNDILASTQNLLRRLIGEQIELQVVPGPNLGAVHADPVQLRQVMLNLALNARDATPEGGRITISTTASRIPDTNQPAIALAVQDTGSGMDAETRSHLFEPFFTTKKAGHGTGLGLAMVQRIVHEAGGKIEVTSAIGSGTKFVVFFPELPGEPRVASSA